MLRSRLFRGPCKRWFRWTHDCPVCHDGGLCSCSGGLVTQVDSWHSRLVTAPWHSRFVAQQTCDCPVCCAAAAGSAHAAVALPRLCRVSTMGSATAGQAAAVLFCLASALHTLEWCRCCLRQCSFAWPCAAAPAPAPAAALLVCSSVHWGLWGLVLPQYCCCCRVRMVGCAGAASCTLCQSALLCAPHTHLCVLHTTGCVCHTCSCVCATLCQSTPACTPVVWCGHRATPGVAATQSHT